MNIFTISFANHADKHRVEEDRHWLFDNNFFMIEPFDGFIQFKNMQFDHASRWIQLHNLPLIGIDKSCRQKIGNTIGTVEEVDVGDDDVSWENNLRAKVTMDLTKLIARGRTITIKGVKHWIPVRYEKLPRVCFTRGYIVHNPKLYK